MPWIQASPRYDIESFWVHYCPTTAIGFDTLYPRAQVEPTQIADTASHLKGEVSAFWLPPNVRDFTNQIQQSQLSISPDSKTSVLLYVNGIAAGAYGCGKSIGASEPLGCLLRVI